MALGPLLALVAFALGALRAQTAGSSTTPNPPTSLHFKSTPHAETRTSVTIPVPNNDTSTPSLSTRGPEALLTSTPPEATESANETRTGTAGPVTGTPLASSEEPLTSQKAESASPSTATDEPSREEDDSSLSKKPGLVAVICIFLSILLIGAVVILVKCCRAREPAFHKLDEVPMQGKAAEDSPFARYPPK